MSGYVDFDSGGGGLVAAGLSIPGATGTPVAVGGPAHPQITVSFAAPTTGGIPTDYTVTSTPAGMTDSNSGSSSLSHLMTGGTDGVVYTFVAVAHNAQGFGPNSSPSNGINPALPGAPTALVATPGNGQLSVAFTAPAYAGASAITGYTLTASPGSATVSGASSPLVLTGLTNGTPYTVTAVATNGSGSGPASAQSVAATPSTIPGVPTIGTATAGNAQVSVSFTPGSTGGLTVVYTVKIYDAVSHAYTGISNSGLSSPIVVGGLTNGYADAYYATVLATNTDGSSAESAASLSFTPSGAAGTPSAPISPIAFADGSGPNYTLTGGWAWVTFGAPSSDGGSQLTGYRATVVSGPSGTVGTTADSPGIYTAFNGVSCRCDFTQLPAGTYTFAIQGKNANGLGAASVATAAVVVGSLISPYYMTNGNGLVGTNVWTNYNPGGSNYNDTTGPIYPGQTSSVSLPTGSYTLTAWNDPVTHLYNASGALNLANFNYVILKIYASAKAADTVTMTVKFHAYVHGLCTGGTSGHTVEDVNQKGSGPGWNGSMAISPAGLNNLTTATIGYTIASNTTSTVTNTSGATFSPGDMYYWSHSDYGNNTPFPGVNIDSYITSNGGVWQNSAWNTIAIPISAFKIAANLPIGVQPNSMQEIFINNSTGVTIYVTDYGFST